MDLTPYRYDGKQSMDLTQWPTQEIAANADQIRESDLITLQKLQRRLFAQKENGVSSYREWTPPVKTVSFGTFSVA